MNDREKLIYGAGTSTAPVLNPTNLTLEVMTKAIEMIEKRRLDIPEYWYSKVLEPDDIYKISPGQGFGFFYIDISDNTVYICGSNVRDQLIEEGVIFKNFNPDEEEKSS